MRQALEPLVHKVEQMPAKSVHDAKLHAGETILGNQFAAGGPASGSLTCLFQWDKLKIEFEAV